MLRSTISFSKESEVVVKSKRKLTAVGLLNSAEFKEYKEALVKFIAERDAEMVENLKRDPTLLQEISDHLNHEHNCVVCEYLHKRLTKDT